MDHKFEALVESATAALESGNTEDALAYSEQLVLMFPHETKALLLRASALAATRRLDEALQLLRRSWTTLGENPKALSLRRDLAFKLGALDDSQSCARLLSEIAPTDFGNVHYLAKWHLQSKDLEAALANARLLLQHHSGNAKAWRLFAEVQLARQRFEEALEALREGLSIHTDNYALLKLAKVAALAVDHRAEALDYAVRTLKVAPDNEKIRFGVAQLYFQLGDFGAALVHCQELARPTQPHVSILMARCLLTEHRVDDAIRVLDDAIAQSPDDRNLLTVTRNVAFQHGRFDKALSVGLRLTKAGAIDNKNLEYVAQSYMAAGDLESAERYLATLETNSATRDLKAARHLRRCRRLEDTVPPLAEAWRAAVTNPLLQKDSRGSSVPSDARAPLIQYWSQGEPPPDVRRVFQEWEKLFACESFGEVLLFDKTSAEAWIAEWSPEFLKLFTSAFHYAMESDIFRIAYASTFPCIYVDIDGWPLENAARILRFGLQSRRSMLYFRSYRPWIVNGFFISRPECRFFRELVHQSLSVDLSALPRNHDTIEATFGPTRYNKVLREILSGTDKTSVSAVDGVPGCSQVVTGSEQMYFTHEAAVASVKPPFPLNYKVTGDYWKRL